MTILQLMRNFEEERAVMRRRRRRPGLREVRALAARLPGSSARADDEATRVDKSLVGAAAGTAAILTVKVSMLWAALQAF